MTRTVAALNLKPGDVIVSAGDVIGTVASAERDDNNLGAMIVMLTSGARHFVGAYDMVHVQLVTLSGRA